MLLHRIFMLVIAAIGTILSSTAVNGFKTESLKHLMKSGEFVRDSQFLTSPGQVYGSCYEMQTYGNKFQAHCTIGLENAKPIDSPDHQKFCSFTLRLDNVYGKVEYHAQSVTAIGENKAVLTLESTDSMKFFVLHFSDCRAVLVNMDVEPQTAVVTAPFDDLFDIVVTNAGDFCTVDKPCKTTVDTEGKIVTKTRRLTRKLANFVAVVHSPAMGRLVVQEHSSSAQSSPVTRIIAIDDKGSTKHLWEKRLHKAHQSIHYDPLIVSTTNDLLTACSALDAGLVCGQFDLNGKNKFETSLPINNYLSVRSMNIHNLSDGGFLLVVSECSESQKKCAEAKDWFMVYKIGVDGRISGEFKTMKPNKIDPKLLHFFENEEDGMCLSYAMQENENAVLNIVCFRDNEFMYGA